MDCIFCKIVNKEIPVEPVFENDLLMVINDKYPKAPIHMLVIPKVHIGSVATLNEEYVDLLGKMIILAKNIAEQKNIKDYKLVFNNGIYSEIPHLHLHILGGANLE